MSAHPSGRPASPAPLPPLPTASELPADLQAQLAAEDRRDQGLLRLMLGVTLVLLLAAWLVTWA